MDVPVFQPLGDDWMLDCVSLCSREAARIAEFEEEMDEARALDRFRD